MLTAPTLKDVALAAGVSVAAVSKVLNDRQGVSAASRARVLQVVDDLGYQHRGARVAVAAPLASATIVTLDRYVTNDNFYGEITRGILDGAAAENLAIEIDLASDGQGADLFRQRSPNAVLLVGVDSADVLDRVAGLGCPAVIVNGMDRHMRLSSVSPDYQFGGYAATRHLLDLGHREIVHVTHPYRHSIRQRLEGFRDALEEAGIGFDPARHVLDLKSPRFLNIEARQAVSAYLAAAKRPPTAFVCVSDIIALGTIQAIEAAGLSVPEDVSVIGFDGLPIGAHSAPPLTTMAIERHELGVMAIRMLMNQASNRVHSVRRMALGVKLVKRGSTAPPPARGGTELLPDGVDKGM